MTFRRLRERLNAAPRGPMMAALLVAAVGLGLGAATAARHAPEIGCVITHLYQVDRVPEADVPAFLEWIEGQCGEVLHYQWVQTPAGPELILTWRTSRTD